MIKANELMIGNWLYSKTLNKFERVWKPSDIDWIVELGDSVTGIALSPEILEKAGFGRYENEGDWFYRDTDFHIWEKDRSGEYYFVNSDWQEEGVGFKYLHQLQNLFFALTGEELNVEL